MSEDLGFRFSWSGHAAVELETRGGTHVVFDPWFGNPRSTKTADEVTACDLMLVTHGHGDHLGDSIAIASRLRPAWPCIHELSLWLARQLPGGADQVLGMNKGGTVAVAGLRVTMVHAEHSAGDWNADAGVPLYLGEPVGFVVELENGRRVYFAGDTDVFGDMALIRELHKPEVAFLPIGGHYTMDPRGAARAATLLGVSTVVPIHYGTFPALAGTPAELRAALGTIGAGNIQVVSPEPGQVVG